MVPQVKLVRLVTQVKLVRLVNLVMLVRLLTQFKMVLQVKAAIVLSWSMAINGFPVSRYKANVCFWLFCSMDVSIFLNRFFLFKSYFSVMTNMDVAAWKNLFIHQILKPFQALEKHMAQRQKCIFCIFSVLNFWQFVHWLYNVNKYLLYLWYCYFDFLQKKCWAEA